MRRNKLSGIIAVIILIMSLVLMYFYLTYGQQVFATKAVLVANMDIEPGTIVNSQVHFSERNIRNEDLIPGSLCATDIANFEGKASVQFIPKNGQISSRFFEIAGLVMTGDEFVFKIPNQWIYAVPSSIRRGDDILVYEIDSRIDQQIDISPTTNEDNIISSYLTVSGITLGASKPIIESTVMYVKDSANREVVDVDGKIRLDGTSQVASIEIVCTKDELSQLEAKIAEGKKLILVYR